MYHRSEEWKAPAPPPATYQGAMLPISSSLIKVSISASCKRLFTICASRGEEEYTSMSSSSFRSLVMVGFVLSQDLRYRFSLFGAIKNLFLRLPLILVSTFLCFDRTDILSPHLYLSWN